MRGQDGRPIATATLTSRGRVTIPKEIRGLLGVVPGGEVTFRRKESGEIVLEAAKIDLMSLAGMFEPKRKGVTIEDMNEATRRGWSGG